MKKLLLFIAVGVGLIPVLFSCSDSIEQATVEYYITASQSNNYENLQITFDYARAYVPGDDPGSTAIRTVYLDSQQLSLALDGLQEPVFLGTSTIEPGKILGYDFSFSSISVLKNGNEIVLRYKDYNESNKVEKEIRLTPGEVRKVVFEIVTDESVVLLPNNELKFLAKIQY